jgi:hypothetical protein
MSGRSPWKAAGLDTRKSGRVEHLTLGDLVGPDKSQCSRAEFDHARGLGLAPGDRLGPDVHHAGAALGVDVRQLGHVRSKGRVST